MGDIDDLLAEQADAFGGRGVSAEDLAFDAVPVILETVEDGEVRIDGGVEQPVDEGVVLHEQVEFVEFDLFDRIALHRCFEDDDLSDRTGSGRGGGVRIRFTGR